MAVYTVDCQSVDRDYRDAPVCLSVRSNFPDNTYGSEEVPEIRDSAFATGIWNCFVRYSNSGLTSYKKKKINNLLAMYPHVASESNNCSVFGGTIEALDSDFSPTTTWNSAPNSRALFLHYFPINKSSSLQGDAYIAFPCYNVGYIGYNGTAIRSLYDQLPIGFRFGNNALTTDKKDIQFSCYVPEFRFEFEDWNPVFTPQFPASGAYVKPTIAETFSVSFPAFESIDYPTAQTVTYEIKDVATSAVTSHDATVSINLRNRTYVDWTVPAGTMEAAKNYQWRAKLTTDDGETSFSDWASFTTSDATPTATTIIAPQSKYLVGSDEITLQWHHNVTTGSAQYAYDLQYRQGGDWVSIAAHTVSSVQSYTLAANYFSAGTMYWRVRTYNSDDVVGEWGTSSANVIQAKPVTPIIGSITATPRITIGWQSTGQVAYRLIIKDADESIVFDSDEVYGPQKQLTIDDYLDDGAYEISLQIENALGLWSDTATRDIMVSNNAPSGDDYLSATPVFGGVRLTISIAEPIGAYYLGDGMYVGDDFYLIHQPSYAEGTRYVLRDGNPIAKITGTSYTDYSASGTHEYIFRTASTDGNFRDTNSVSAAPIISYACIAKLDSPDKIMSLKFGEGAPPKLENTLSKVYSSHYFAGRVLPCHDVTEHHDSAWNYTYSLLNISDYDALYGAFLDGETVIFRDSRGYKAIGTLTSLKKTPNRNTMAISFTITETDVQEAIDYD